MIDVFKLADYLLYLGKEKSKIDGEEDASDITPLKLQKLLYYCQGYSLGLYGKKLFNNIIEAWDYGPVIPEIYKKYKTHKGSVITFSGNEPDIGDNAKKIANIVMQDKGRFAPWALRDMTHNEFPWKHTFFDIGRNGQISVHIIQEFFSSIFEEELSDEKEEELFNSAGRSPTAEEWREISEYVGAL